MLCMLGWFFRSKKRIIFASLYFAATVTFLYTGRTLHVLNYTRRSTESAYLSNLTPKGKKLELQSEPLYNISATCAEKIYLLIIVTSKTENQDRRTFIRSSWANSYKRHVRMLKSPNTFKGNESYPVENVVKVVFLVGKSKDNVTMALVNAEAEYEGDLIMGGFLDTYKNLTMKVRTGLKWSYFACESKFILKTDDDVFVNSVWLVEWLKGEPESAFYGGYCDPPSQVIRNLQSKWYVPMEEYAQKYYPAYCQGVGYILSRDVLKNILEISYGEALLSMEDVYIGILVHRVSKNLSILVRDERKHFIRHNRKEPALCDLRNVFLLHDIFDKKAVIYTNRVTKSFFEC